MPIVLMLPSLLVSLVAHLVSMSFSLIWWLFFTAECVSVLSEDNLIPQFTTDENLLLMKSFLLNYSSSAPLLHLATLSASIILNLVPSPDTDLLNTIFQMVEVTLSESCLPQVQQEIDFILNVCMTYFPNFKLFMLIFLLPFSLSTMRKNLWHQSNQIMISLFTFCLPNV